MTPSESTTTNPSSAQSNASMGELVSRLSEEMSSLVRGEMELARLELTEKAKHAGKGAGAFGGAGLVALYGLGVLIATAILALALVMDAWLAALIVGVVLLVIAGVMAMVGKKQVSEGTPMKPERATENVKRDVEAVKHRGHDDGPVVRSKS
ncbi:membrane protein [Nocardioides luteus]|uniref:Membrane protein n=1 Tax=Nocardioides luteus TaxID=1844 RepID=A0ABQ5ST10_9ACTN|nr:membrane protein [Nocardioides luteus]GLJ66738.1 membrane protein [Nocardioides luteus]